MRVVSTNVYMGPNLYAHFPCIRHVIDLGELEVAEAHYRESLAIEPQPAIYNDLGFVLARQGLPHEAAEMYRKSLDLEPESATAHYNLAATLAGSGELAEAGHDLLFPAHPEPQPLVHVGGECATDVVGVVTLEVLRTHCVSR